LILGRKRAKDFRIFSLEKIFKQFYANISHKCRVITTLHGIPFIILFGRHIRVCFLGKL